MTQNTEKWGKATARARYGGGPTTFGPPSGEAQKPQDPIDKHGPKYDNDTPSNWLRGMPSAEGKPGFDKKKSGA